MTTQPKIKPCPFCGIVPKRKDFNVFKGYYEEGGRDITCTYDKCEVNLTVLRDNMEEAIKAWNTRKGEK